MNNDPYLELATKADGHHRRLETIEQKLRDKSGNLSDIRERLRKLETKVGDHSISAVQAKIDTVGTNLRTTDKRLTREAAELRRNVEALHRKIRVSSGLPRADFDNWQQEIPPEMIKSILAGLASAPVSAADVQQLRTKQERAKKKLADWDEAQRAAIRAARMLADMPPVAERAWRKEARTWLAFRDRGPRPVKDEERARRQRDDAARAHESAEVVAARSREADNSACETIRERIEEAISRDLILPTWFENALGQFPPTRPERIEPWLVAATNLVRYRLLADFHNQVHPYGERPEDSRLTAEYDQVVRRCAELRPS
ncbi:hypothetical protein ABZ345_06890 [Lentzea sp. NPDC005914]|uniref:hypothetical protein n=1 Tax=Lentzea sp. NPDC005914 TaxID=3154572 RepID=UPI0033FE5F4D